jgi:transcription antitermination factor NusG
MEKVKKWYAIYTKPRWEKKVQAGVSRKGIEAYCPLNKVTRTWSDRVKIIEEPLFKSYVFVKVSNEEMGEARLIDGVLNFVYWQGRPAEVKESEIEDVKRFLNENSGIRVEVLNLKPHSKVIIRGGVLMDKEATVIRVLGHTAEVVIESLGFKLVAQIKKTNLIEKL